jgi:hypothetical protein
MKTQYVLDWQVKKYEAECVELLETKLAIIYAHYTSNKTVEAKSRVLRWLRNLQMSQGIWEFPIVDHYKIDERIDEITCERPRAHDNHPINPIPPEYGTEILRNIAKDLLTAQLENAKRGRSQEDLDKFLLVLAKHMDNKKLRLLSIRHVRLAHKNHKAGKR